MCRGGGAEYEHSTCTTANLYCVGGGLSTSIALVPRLIFIVSGGGGAEYEHSTCTTTNL